MRYALLFGGQGTQHPAMLPWLEAEPACQALLEQLGQAVGTHWRAELADAGQRSRNGFAQPLLVATSLAAHAALAQHLSAPPTAVAGYSVGELSAFACAGVFSPQTAMALASSRAACMDAAAQGQQGGLLSVSGLSMQAVLQTCPELFCAIHLGADQGIYAGLHAQLERSAATLAARGALCRRLEVQVASHSPWMHSAAAQFALHLQDLAFARPVCPVACDATGMVTRQVVTLRAALSQQIASTVQWAACMDAVAEQGVDAVLELGPGTALAKMWNQRHPGIAARALEEFQDASGAARWLQRQCMGA